MAEIWWQVGQSWEREVVKEVSVIRTTEHMVVYETEWMGKKSEFRTMKRGDFFKTFSEAKEEAIRRAKVDVGRAQSQLDREKERLKLVNDFPAPPRAQ